jgi:hypothetical protein
MINHAFDTDDLQRLLRSFPGVPPRIISAVLAGYTTLNSAPGYAAHATHQRLTDALTTA